ncbi:variant leucine-rich repeat-containing protein [Leucobacter sp. HY1910]
MTQPEPPASPWGPGAGGVPVDATAEQLATLAANRPDLWAQILAHPNCYDGLRAWVTERGGAAGSGDTEATRTVAAGDYEEATRTVAASDFERTTVAGDLDATVVGSAFDPAPDFQASQLPPPVMPAPPVMPGVPGEFSQPMAGSMPPPAFSQAGYGQPAFEQPSFDQAAFGQPPAVAGPAAFGAGPHVPGAAPSQGAPGKRRGKVWLAAGLAAALAVSGGGVALALTDTWPFGDNGVFGGGPGSGAASRAAALDAGLTFADGAQKKWTVDSDDYVFPNSGEDIASSWFSWLPTRASIAQDTHDVPVATESAVAFIARGENTTLVVLDAKTGETIVEEDLGDQRGSCIADDFAQEEVFYCVTSDLEDASDSTLWRMTIDGKYTQKPLDEAYDRVAVGKDRIVVASTSWNDGAGVAAYDRKNLKELWASGTKGHGAGYGIDLSGKRTLLRSGSGWELFDAQGKLLADASFKNLYEGGDGSCDAMLTPQDQLLIAGSDCTDLDESEFWEIGDSLAGKHLTGENSELLLATDEGYTELFRLAPKGKFESLWEQDHGGAYLGQSLGDDAAMMVRSGDKVYTYDAEDGTEVSSWTFSGDVDGALGTSGNSTSFGVLDADGTTWAGGGLYDPYSGAMLAELNLEGHYPFWITRAGLLVAERGCEDCSMAGGNTSLRYLSLYAPTSKGKGTSAQPAGSVSIPDSISVDCPADTILLAWGEFADGWVLVCGVSMNEPTFMAYQAPGSKQVLYSLGAKQPTGADAKAAVHWDAGLSRYSAELEGGDRVTLDYDIGTAVRRDSGDRKTIDQQRFVRYIFVPLGEKVRTVGDASRGDGAFDVQAPEDTAEDQVRYMIEVLEKAYSGRALVKDALPKLQYCTASAGGYSDTVSAMQTVRDNRAELLSALDAMPVDKIPEGSALLDDLYDAIDASHRANIEYVAWAEQANANGCASLSSAGERAAAESDPPKERFASRWNRVVAPKFGVRTFDGWFI